MTKRRVSKGTRFDIFKRDGFTCQYCGRQPPETVLHLDHIMPIAKGGTNDVMNLITACQPCNLGKGKKLLDKPQRPDADLAWLEMQQEIAELEAYQRALHHRNDLLAHIVVQLQLLWIEQSGLRWSPDEIILLRMLGRYSPAIVEESIANVARKMSGGYIRQNEWERYTWGVLRNKAEGI